MDVQGEHIFQLLESAVGRGWGGGGGGAEGKTAECYSGGDKKLREHFVAAVEGR